MSSPDKAATLDQRESSKPKPTGVAARLLQLEDFGWIEGLEFRSRSRAKGLYSGSHRSSQLGGCSEFADHREYHPGDPLRQLDWRLLAKRDRHYIKRYEDERTIATMLIVDRSGSMGFGHSTPTKFDHALRAAACFARLLLGQRDPVGLASWNVRGRGMIVPPRSTPSHFEALFQDLAPVQPQGENHLPALVESILPLFPERMRVVLLSDGFMDSETNQDALHRLTASGHEVIFGHVLAPEELEFQFTEGMRFEDLEAPDDAPAHLDIDPAVYRDSYLEKFNAFLDELQESCTRLGCGYLRLTTDQSVGAMLAAFLRRWNTGSLAPVLAPDDAEPKAEENPRHRFFGRRKKNATTS